ncbi:hypothetical protein EDD86DRAFT_274394 [Gorgonomyces haynaldii]|nr:hypothetical protein EDD86DRAFT_274394 [Gorgonomyces haynaldii]
MIQKCLSKFKQLDKIPTEILDTIARLLKEYLLLDRLYYRNKNQHRRSQHLQRLELIRRLVKRYQALEFPKLLSLPAPEPGNLDYHDLTTICHYFDDLMNRLLKGHVLSLRLLDAYKKCYLDFRHLVQQTYFMTNSLIFMAICSRMFVLQQHLMKQQESLYHQLQSLRLDQVKFLNSRGQYQVKDNQLPHSLGLAEQFLVHGSVEEKKVVEIPEIESDFVPIEIESAIATAFWSQASQSVSLQDRSVSLQQGNHSQSVKSQTAKKDIQSVKSQPLKTSKRKDTGQDCIAEIHH